METLGIFKSTCADPTPRSVAAMKQPSPTHRGVKTAADMDSHEAQAFSTTSSDLWEGDPRTGRVDQEPGLVLGMADLDIHPHTLTL
ncbi:hypothetical protein NUU61_004325 [Penicillium alfredii]|uniref:Uncharacterized protein n=1 Tax=Penicillium alfredii TaxID=1506179 RepID=A0A9W9KDU9_9EURO|nr:uncharacterized protein NUU61_004325 [Penicillium alfredii]KAJ5102103.1 hypothetical protein NUU61_004325 [Penicillium alfredii]